MNTLTTDPGTTAADALPDPRQMQDQELAAELAKLHSRLRGSLPRAERAALGNRNRSLTEESDRRAHELSKAIRAQQDEQERQARQERTSLGRLNEHGRYPVEVDGRLRGYVFKQGRSWYLHLEGEDKEQEGGERRRLDAVDRLVRVIDFREEQERARQQLRAVPGGWRLDEGVPALSVGEVVRYEYEGRGGWSEPLRVVARVEEPPPYGVRFRLEPLDGRGPGWSLPGARLPRVVRPEEETAAAFPPVPFSHRDPAEHEARRLLGGEVGDELSGLSKKLEARERALRALKILDTVQQGRSSNPAAAMLAVAIEAEAIEKAVRRVAGPNWVYYASSARAALLVSARAALRFEQGGGRLTAPAGA
ncbi:hypothetical protein LN042_22975 [Kitasatospora sp. RB6PN24]|uniref:hypothetical protein n=1 Tax=Kitasatospora humi TaxID=2893891 RepID=UPI001E2BB1AD|nr:hypothetical protein [Kitasatospora humi]MCC9309899.1 hypothetical protein [Kitasatospora humi]